MANYKFSFVTTVLLGISACGDVPPATNISPHTSEFIRKYEESRGITDETHGSFATIAYFNPSDTPQSLPRRDSSFSGNGLRLLAGHSQGHSVIEVLYPLNVHHAYARNGKGPAVPLQVRIDPPAHPTARYPRTVYRRVRLDQDYSFSRRLYDMDNREAAIELSREVLSKTHCRGGTLTEDNSKGDFAQAYGPRNRAGPHGATVSPGWIVSYRCSRWRKR